MHRRDLNAGESAILAVIQQGYGPQNTADAVFFTGRDEAVILGAYAVQLPSEHEFISPKTILWRKSSAYRDGLYSAPTRAHLNLRFVIVYGMEGSALNARYHSVFRPTTG